MTETANEPWLSTAKTWQGRWSDGKTAAAHDVEITLKEEALQFRRNDQQSAVPEIWPIETIESPHPIHPDDKTVLLTSRQAPQQRLFIDQENFAKRILDQAPNVSHKAHNWGMLKWPLGIAASLVLFWALTYFDVISPANSLAKILPDGARTALGSGVINTIKGKNKVCTTPEGNKALTKLIARLKPATGSTNNLDIKVMDLNIVNAFAAPGDHIVVSGKLIKQAANPDELSGVIAHEIGHAIERHPEAGIIRAFGLITIMQILTAGESSAVGDIAFFLIQSGYSRSAETEADQHAASILKKVNISTKPLAGFFERLSKRRASFIKKKEAANDKSSEKSPTGKNNQTQSTKKTKDKSIFSWLSTHPATQERIKFFNQSTITTSPEILNQTEWRALQKICGTNSKAEKSNTQNKDDEKK